MVATLTALGMAAAVAANKGADLIPQILKDPKHDAVLKVALAAGIVLVGAAWIKEPKAKALVLAVGVGAGIAAGTTAFRTFA